MITVTADEIQNNFAKYLQAVQDGDEILIIIDGRKMARLSLEDPEEPVAESFSDLMKTSEKYRRNFKEIPLEELVGVLKGNYDYKEMRDERYEKMREKYESLG